MKKPAASTGGRRKPAPRVTGTPARVVLAPAGPDDAAGTAALASAAAERLTREFGKGPWSAASSERGVLAAMRRGPIFVARQGPRVVATLALSTRKPWAIDTTYFSPASRPLYLTGMAVDPAIQRRGVGRLCMEEAARIARQWPADAIRLDAYDADAGAGVFYARCGYREVGRVTYRRTPLVYYELRL